MKSLLKTVLTLIAIVVTVSACGGGGGSSTTPTTLTEAQVKTAVAELNGLRIGSIDSLEALVPAE